MANMNLTNDNSFDVYLSTDTKPTTGVPNKRVALEVDTKTWYLFWKGTWYAQ